MKIKVIHKSWMEKMNTVDLEYDWCCKEAKKYLDISLSDGIVSFSKYIVKDGNFQSFFDVFISFCPFCGKKFEVVNE